MSSPKALVLALSGGGGHAAAHAGVIVELAANGIKPTGYAGVSGGALVGAAYLGGASMEALVDEASQLHPWFWVRGWGGGLLSGTKLGILIDQFLPKERFEELAAPPPPALPCSRRRDTRRSRARRPKHPRSPWV